ncbi:ribosome maturation factor RimM [Aestuariirhabdus sp. Z084]|uniref:ribosome maturation factor RimM n=1 Tax=Aestuariirhabdus haliotis TaxID=2918751 RepID=UPI00201B3A04|nr:ribosome maturation factor RimM [Aestuariirhabdus haliotis]MCL6415861.1 ribosome maturation factor RimM [Aestuariirhabdus haliotis]MCL6419837.1 ribosome maturation factor RimM [Aestuariirhabdus haliotis]
MATAQNKEQIVLGRITTVYGVKGWLKVHSYTEPMDNILNYSQWTLNQQGRKQTVEIDQGRHHGKGLVVRLKGCDDREVARTFTGSEILVERSQLPTLDNGEYYWHQLQGLEVITDHVVEGGRAEPALLGKVAQLMETGANDVLVVRACKGSIDKRERLIPYLQDQVINEVNLEEGFVRVDWDPEF